MDFFLTNVTIGTYLFSLHHFKHLSKLWIFSSSNNDTLQ